MKYEIKEYESLKKYLIDKGFSLTDNDDRGVWSYEMVSDLDNWVVVEIFKPGPDKTIGKLTRRESTGRPRGLYRYPSVLVTHSKHGETRDCRFRLNVGGAIDLVEDLWRDIWKDDYRQQKLEELGL